MTTPNTYGYNKSGAFGFMRIEPSDLADIGRWELNTENTVPEFCHSGSNGFNVTVKGKCRGDVAGEQVLNTEDEIYYRAQVGDLVTLKLYEDRTRYFELDARFKTYKEAVEIDQASEIRVPFTATVHGGWWFPKQGTNQYSSAWYQTGGENPTGDPNYNEVGNAVTVAPINIPPTPNS